jgi:predicted ribosome quality control (RQC) complex YloA/Tae2 family protein
MKTQNVFLQGLNREITFYIGTNQSENFDVIHKGKPDDLWFHADDISSCHVVAHIPHDIVNKELHYIIKAGELLCKINTNKLKKNKNVEFVYTKIKHVELTNIQGSVNITNEKKLEYKNYIKNNSKFIIWRDYH